MTGRYNKIEYTKLEVQSLVSFSEYRTRSSVLYYFKHKKIKKKSRKMVLGNVLKAAAVIVCSKFKTIVRY
jgi:hypothetical protein